MYNDVATILRLMAQPYFLTNVLPYWVAAATCTILIVRRMK